jgi:cell division protein FtsW (lipid II flippase)
LSIATFLRQLRRTDRREALLFVLALAILGLLTAGMLLAPAARRSGWEVAPERLQLLALFGAIAVCAAVARRALRHHGRSRDPFLLPTAYLLAGWGVLAIWRVAPAFGWRQAVWLAVSTLALLGVMGSPADMRWLRRYRYLWLGSALVLIATTFLLGTNPSGGGPRLWLGCCGLYFQPSEPLRLFLIAFLASYLADRLSPAWRLEGNRLLATAAPLALVWGLSIAMLLAQRDLGTGSLFLFLLAALLYVAFGRPAFVLIAAGVVGAGALAGAQVFPWVQARMESWWNPWSDPGGSSYQIVQALMAYGAGGLFGRGPGMGSPTLVPLAHSDLIYAVVVEEQGLIGAVALIVLLALLAQRAFRLARNRRSAFQGILCAGIGLAFALQTLLILGGSVRLLPLTGITVPFLSYGGSSLVTSFVALGLLGVTRPGESSQPQAVHRVSRIQGTLGLAWAGVALLTAWWAVARGPELAQRSDNARRSLAERYARRGEIEARGGVVLAETTGVRGLFQRSYPRPAAASVVGFDSALHGQTGIEASLDAWLRGERGHTTGVILASWILRGVPPDGLSVRLTLDASLQQEAWESMAGRRGAVLVLQPQSGEILVLLSSPGYDPGRIDEDWEVLRSRRDAPLFNRATQGRYQPGGVLAPFLLAWADRVGLVQPAGLVPDAADPVEIDDGRLECLVAPKEAQIPFTQALALGCPAPFARLAIDLGPRQVGEMVAAFQFDRVPPLDLATAVPSEWTRPASDDDLLRFGAGQSDLLVGPVQIARAFSALFREGEAPALRLVDSVRDPNGSWTRWASADTSRPVLPASVGRDIVGGLPLGTQGQTEFHAVALSGPGQSMLAWYIAGWPAAAPELLVVVVVEDGTPSEVRQIGLTAMGLDPGAGGEP